MKLQNAINEFYFNMTLNELHLMHSDHAMPNITYNSLLYLDIIAYHEDCTVSYLADALHVAKSAVTLKVNELIKLNLVEKRQSSTDKRINYLSVKQEALDRYKIYDDALYHVVKKIQENYSQKEIDTFCEILKQIDTCYTEEKFNEQPTGK